MAKKKWSNYWKGYKSSAPKSSKVKISKSIKITRPEISNIPIKNKQVILFVVSFIAIIGLSYLNFKTGNYVKVLEINITSLENDLSLCNNRTQNLTFDLGACNTSLDTCNEDLSDKKTELSDCKKEKSDLDSSLSTCQSDLNTKKSQYDSCMGDLSSSSINLQNCQSTYNTCTNNYNACNSNYNALKTNYAKKYCCMTGYLYYHMDGNQVVCTNTTSETSAGC